MKDSLSTVFLNRQYMISKDFEIYYYKDYNFRNVEKHSHFDVHNTSMYPLAHDVCSV